MPEVKLTVDQARSSQAHTVLLQMSTPEQTGPLRNQAERCSSLADSLASLLWALSTKVPNLVSALPNVILDRGGSKVVNPDSADPADSAGTAEVFATIPSDSRPGVHRHQVGSHSHAAEQPI